MAANKTITTQTRGNETLAAAVTDVSERVTQLIRDEIELAKAETVAKVSSLARGLIAIAIGAVFGVFALVIALETLGWGLAAIFTNVANIWIGFVIVTGALVALTAGAFLFAWRKLKVGAPTPKMAIEEAKKISATVRNGSTSSNGSGPHAAIETAAESKSAS
jgi:uncharacterized membrane protein YgcG